MSDPRVRSDSRKVRGVTRDTERSHSGFTQERSHAGLRDGYGMGTGSGELPPFTERRAAEFAWAEQHLPDEHPGMVVSALIGLEVAGMKRSTGSVMARLEKQGRTMAQMKSKGWA